MLDRKLGRILELLALLALSILGSLIEHWSLRLVEAILQLRPGYLDLGHHIVHVRLVDAVVGDVQPDLVLLHGAIQKGVDDVTHRDIVFEPIVKAATETGGFLMKV